LLKRGKNIRMDSSADWRRGPCTTGRGR
jgi:hypothetical protein